MKKKKGRSSLRSTRALNREIHVYDDKDTTLFINRSKRMKLADFGVELPSEAPTKVLSLRLLTSLLNRIKAYAGEHDVPYSAIIKMLLAEGIESKLRNMSRAGSH